MLTNLLGLCGSSRNKVTAEMTEKVGDEELTQEQVETLDTEVDGVRAGMNRDEKVKDDIARIQSFQQGLKVYGAQHGEKALEEK